MSDIDWTKVGDMKYTWPPLNWTTEPPTQEGWYWAKTRRGVYMFNMLLGPSRMYFESANMRWDEGMDEYKVTHWLGPLPVPDAPR